MTRVEVEGSGLESWSLDGFDFVIVAGCEGIWD
jgi:hypothetical protein